MSSAVYITLRDAIDTETWLTFCERHSIAYSPHTIGRNVFYADDVEIVFGESAYNALPRLANGQLDFAQARPPDSAISITVSTFWMGNLRGVADVARAILDTWPSTFSCDPELAKALAPVEPGAAGGNDNG